MGARVINIDTFDNPYGIQIRNFFQTEFPTQMEKSKTDLLELVTNSILATGKIRLGPRPAVESLFAIRQTLNKHISVGLPIPFLMPWGSEKPQSFQTVDMAEVAAFKTIECLGKRVESVYAPGIHVRIRVEDATAPSLFYDRQEQARLDAKIYTSSLLKLREVLGVSSIELVPETSMIHEDVFNVKHEETWPMFEDYLRATISSKEEDYDKRQEYKALVNAGWIGIIPKVQRDYYYSTYRKLYNTSDEQGLVVLARYLSQSLVRKKLNMLGNKDWTDYLGLSFVPPIPGEPQARAAKRIYYRTIPENISSFHMPPWRAKGYFSMGDGVPRLRLASWNDKRNYHEAKVKLTNGDQSVIVRTDYEVL